MNTAPELDRSLEGLGSDEGAKVMIDLTECDFIDSTGIALIVRSWQRLDSEGDGGGSGQLVLCCSNTQVMRLLRITGVESSISVHAERDGALADLRGPARAGGGA